MQFPYQFDPGHRPELATNTDAWTDEDNHVAGEHYERLRQATGDGTVLLARLSTDGRGPAVVILEAASEAAARHFMEHDPFVRNSLFTATLHPFRASLVRGEDS